MSPAVRNAIPNFYLCQLGLIQGLRNMIFIQWKIFYSVSDEVTSCGQDWDQIGIDDLLLSTEKLAEKYIESILAYIGTKNVLDVGKWHHVGKIEIRLVLMICRPFNSISNAYITSTVGGENITKQIEILRKYQTQFFEA